MFSIWGSPFPFGDYRTEMGRETRMFPYGESPFLNRVCFHLGINKYTKQVKRNRSTAGSVGKGIANKATEEKFSDAEAQAMVITEVANVLQALNAEQTKNMMAMFEKLISSMPTTVMPAAVTPPKTPHQPRNECPHCKKKHANHDKCWKLDANKALRPANLKSTKST